MSGFDTMTALQWERVLERILAWSDLLDWAAMAGVLLLLIFLVTNRIRYKRWVLERTRRTIGPPTFGEDLDAEIVRSRIRQTLETLNRNAQMELDRLLDGRSNRDRTQGAFQWSGSSGESGIGTSGPPDYQAAFSMARKGADPQSLETAAGLSEGEAELVFNVQRFQTGG